MRARAVIRSSGPKATSRLRRLVHGESAYFIGLNRGKNPSPRSRRRVTRLFEAMLSKADVFVQNLKPARWHGSASASTACASTIPG
jgi:crotonobetainyl-CoA:carnitine CoA-transferase CaiB-like acyl-CoA transferase